MELVNHRTNKLSKRVLSLDILFLFLCTIFGILMGLYLAPKSRDFLNYAEYFNSLTNIYASSGERFEFGFSLLATTLSKLFPGYTQILYIIVIPISLYIKFYVLRKYEINNDFSVILLFSLYLISFSILLELNQLRAAIAISFGYLSVLNYANKKKILSIVFLFLAFSMHYSSIFFGLGLLCAHYTNINKIKFLFFIITVFCIVSKSLVIIIEKLNPIAAEYSKNYDQAPFGLKSITLILAIIYFVYHFYNIKKESKLACTLIMFLYSGILFSLVMSSIPVYATRILELTEVGIIFIAANKKYTNYYEYGSALLTIIVIFHKFVAYSFVNPLLDF